MVDMAASRLGKNQDWKHSQLTVALRIRPLTKTELEAGNKHIAHAVEDNVVVLMDPAEDDPDDVLRTHRSREKHYIFDYAFDDAASQEEVYTKSTKSLIKSVTEGYNATVFAYGATGAGKTYTMLGKDDEPGIMARALNDLFREMESKVENSVYKVTMSYIEIYNEMIRDLLNPTSGYLDLREDASGNVQVAGISETSTMSTSEVMLLLTRGNKERTQEPTAANKTSSRSHAVLQVTITEQSRVRTTHQMIRTGKLFMIDLAGSERASNTKNRGKRMIEGAHINRSLLALGNCINALCEGGKYVNYRDSKLTRLLKDALGGNCKTLMIANVSPASFQYEESRNTLLYADRAKAIKMKVKTNMTSVKFHIAQYTNIIAELKQEIERLKKKISQQEVHPKIADVHSEVERVASQEDRAEMQKLHQMLMSNFQRQMELRQQMMEVENQKWEISVEASKHFSEIAEWEQEKARLALKQDNIEMDNKLKEENQEKELDSYSMASDSTEPEDIVTSRQDLGRLMTEQSRLRTRQSELGKRLDDFRRDAATLEEVLPRKVTTEEQGEILNMLCKVHELEVENTELKSSQLVHKHNIQLKETMITKYEKHRQLCDEIIQQQKTLLNKHDVNFSSDLMELYDRYTGAVFEDIHKLNTRSPIQHMEGIKATSMLNLRALKALQEERDSNSSPEKESTVIEINNNKMAMMHKQASQQADSKATNNDSRVFNPSPRAHQQRQRADLAAFTLPKVKVDSPDTRTSSSDGIDDPFPNSRVASPNNDNLSQIQSMQNLKIYDSRSEKVKSRKEIGHKTRSIAAVAARKRTSQKTLDKNSGGSRPAKMNLHERTVMSLRSVYETSEPEVDDEYLSQSRLAHHNRGHTVSSPFLLGGDSDHEDNMSVATVERKWDSRGHSNKGQLNNKPLLEKRRRRTVSNDQPLTLLKSKPTQRSRLPISRMNRRGGAPKSTPIIHVDGRGGSKLKHPIVSNLAGEQDAMSFKSTSPSPAVIRQIGADKGKGQAIHKRFREIRGLASVASPDNSNHGTPQHRLGRRQLSTIPAYPRSSSLAIAGMSVQKRDRITGRKL